VVKIYYNLYKHQHPPEHRKQCVTQYTYDYDHRGDGVVSDAQANDSKTDTGRH